MSFPMISSRSWMRLSIVAGLMLGMIFTLSPLMVCALIAAAALLRHAGRGLPEIEWRVLTTTLAIAFGLRLVAIGALFITLFYPTLFVWSMTLLKEPLYLLGTSLVFVSAIGVLGHHPRHVRAWSALGIVAGFTIIAGLRPGAIVLAASGIAIAIGLREMTRSAARLAIAAALLFIVAGAVVILPALKLRLIAALETTAKQHAGHVFTIGHPYKTLDEGFYVTPQTPASSSLTLTPDQAARYVVRSLVGLVVIPVPWQIATPRELAYLPEQLVWYTMVLLAPFGVVAGWRRDALVTALLVGAVVPTAVALALTSGNIGTMLRLRGVMVPYLAVLTAVGGCEVLETLASRRRAFDLGGSTAGLEGIRL